MSSGRTVREAMIETLIRHVCGDEKPDMPDWIRARYVADIDALLPVVEAECRRRAAEELRAAYWATAGIPDPDAVRDVLAVRADAIEGRT